MGGPVPDQGLRYELAAVLGSPTLLAARPRAARPC